MSEFMYLFRGGDAREIFQSPEAMQKHMEKWNVWMKELTAKGIMLAGHPLEPGGMTIVGSKMTRTDGPFAEGKEIVGGYLIVKAKDLQEAVLFSKDCPLYETEGTVEVRPIMSMQM